MGARVLPTESHGVAQRATEKKAGNQSLNYNTKVIGRLLVKYLRSRGMSRKDLVDLHNQSTEEFWKWVEQDIEQTDKQGQSGQIST